MSTEDSLGLRRRSVIAQRLDYIDGVEYENVPPDKVKVPVTLWEKFLAWQPSPENRFWKYIKTTTLPGWKEAVKPNIHVGERIYWVFYTLFCYTYCGVLLKWAWDMNNGHPLAMVLEPVEIFVGDLPWPTIDIAMLNSFKLAALVEAYRLFQWSDEYNPIASKLTNITWLESEAMKLAYCVDEICTSQSPLSQFYEVEQDSILTQLQHFSEDYQDIVLKDNPADTIISGKIVPQLLNGMVNCAALIMFCAWNGKTDECKKQFRFIYSDFGGVCAFNGMSQKAMRRNVTLSTLFENEMEPEALDRWLKYNIDKHIVTTEGFNASGKLKSVFDEVPLRQRVAGQPYGLSMVLGYNEDEFTCPQHEAYGYRIGVHSPSEESNIRNFGNAIKPNHENFVAIYPEVILSDPAIMDIPPLRRKCYAADEYPLKYFRKYSKGNCITECLSEVIQEECNCTYISSPKSPGQLLCNPSQKICAKNAERDFYSAGPNRKCSHCLPSCTEIIYKVHVTSIPYSKKNPPRVLKGIDWENKTTAVVHTFYGTMMVTAKMRVVKYGLWEFVGLIGGIIGFVLSYALIDVGHNVLALILFFGGKPKPTEQQIENQRPLSRASLNRILKRRRLHNTENPEIPEIEDVQSGPFVIAADPIQSPSRIRFSDKPKTRRGRVYPKPKSPPPPSPKQDHDHVAVELEMDSPMNSGSGLHYLGYSEREIREYQNL